MANYEFDKNVTGEEIKNMIEKDLGSLFRIKMKKNRIEIVQDAAKGCAIQLQEKAGKTICKLIGYMPSSGMRIAITFPLGVGCLFLGLVTGQVIISGLGPFLAFLVMKYPSQELVRRVAGILEKLARSDNLDEKINVLSRTLNCPSCGKGLELEEQERKEKKFTCPKCNNLFDMNNSPDKLVQSTSKLPEEIECPECGVELELEETERNSKQFTCPSCDKFIDLT